MLEDPDFFEDKRNLSVLLCADGIEKFKDKLGSVTPITCQVVNSSGRGAYSMEAFAVGTG